MKICTVCKRNWDDEFRVCPIDGLVLQVVPDSDPFQGKSVEQLQVGEKIADGDLGPVYRARDPVLGVVAVQFVKAGRIASPVLMEAFGDAVKLAAKLNHPNVIRVYSMTPGPDGSAAVTMEYVEGTSLASFCREHPMLEVGQACGLVKGAAEGILAAHRLSMLHGSLDPSRILITSSGIAKVGGFHRSGLREDPISGSAAMSSLIYMAPERTGIIQDVTIPDYRADVYSLGVILYEILTGRLPYAAKSLQDLRQAMAVDPSPASFVNPQVTPTLSRVVLRALSKYPGDRHNSVEEFIHEIEAALQPMREPERATRETGYEARRVRGAEAESGLFGTVPPAGHGRSAEDLWPEAAQAKPEGEGSFFSWFKTRAKGRSTGKDRERSRAGGDDSFYPRSRRDRGDEGTEEHTVLVSGRRSAKKPGFFDTFSTFSRQDWTGTDALPRRRFSSKVYLLAGLIGLVVVTGTVLLFWFFGSPDTGKMTVQSSPSGARVYLNGEFRGNTPLSIPDIKADVYRLRLQLDGYENFETSIEVAPKADVQREFSLTKEQVLIPAVQPLPAAPPVTPQPASGTASGRPGGVPSEAAFNEALRSRNFFPPATGNAWDILQIWQQRESGMSSLAQEQGQRNLCGALGAVESERLDQKDYQAVRNLLDQVRGRMPNCAVTLQNRYDTSISGSISDLRNSYSAAMSRQNYVTPESDNALKYVRLILNIDPRDPDARALETDLYRRALAQAKARSDARDHQEALNIYTQIIKDYPNLPGGTEALSQAAEHERQKLALLGTLKIPYSVKVRHGHSFFSSLKVFSKRECTGILRVDGFTIEYQSTGEHSFKTTYELLKDVSFSKGKLVLAGTAIPDGKIELEQEEKNSSPSLAEVYQKIQEYRKLREQYLRP